MPLTFETNLVLNVRYAPLMPQFLELRRADLPAIEAALEARDWPTLVRLGHNLYGSGASYGLEAISSLGAQIEGAAFANDEDGLRLLYAELCEFLGSVRLTYRNSVLFVDDQPEILALLRRLFGNDEYLCYFATSATEALELLNIHPVDVVVSDLVMPNMGGLQFLTMVRERFPGTVRMVLSGQAQVPSILAAINTGQVFRYLTKPWRVDAEARAVIAEAVAHANALNDHELPSGDGLQVAPSALREVLDALGGRYLVLGRGERVVAASPDLHARWPMGGHQNDEHKALSSARKIVLDPWHTAWVWAN